MILISVTILTKNSEKHLPLVLASLEEFDEIIVYDTGSTDETLAIASKFPNVKIVRGPLVGFGPTHNQASSIAKHDWILSIDSDEVVTGDMVQEIAALNLDPQCVYSFPIQNYYNDKWIKWCGWYPDRHVRLYNRTKTHFSDALVHEKILLDDMVEVALESPIRHYSYSSISDFLAKMQSYSTLFAEQNAGKKTSSPWQAIVHGFFAFFKSYIIKRGILGGYEGFLISAYNGHTAFYKYLKLYEANQKLNKKQ